MWTVLPASCAPYASTTAQRRQAAAATAASSAAQCHYYAPVTAATSACRQQMWQHHVNRHSANMQIADCPMRWRHGSQEPMTKVPVVVCLCGGALQT